MKPGRKEPIGAWTSRKGTTDMLGSVFRGFDRTTRPLYPHLVDLLERSISAGTLGAGARLPPERELAASLRLSRTTVVSAYRELEARGLVRGHVGRGTFVTAAPEPTSAPFAWRGKVAASAARTSDPIVRDILRSASDPDVISFAAGTPALERFPVDLFTAAIARAVAKGGLGLWGHGPVEGRPALRAAIARRFDVARGTVLVLSGAQQGLDLVSRCLIDPGDAVVVDRPGYLGAILSFRASGARIVGWDVAREDLGELEDLVARHRPKLIYTNPTFQNPTGHTMSLPTRRSLLDLAHRYRVPVLEDDTYRELWIDGPGPPSLHQLDDREVVIALNTFAKMLAPGLRLGWLAAAPAIVDQLVLLKQRSEPHTQALVQDAVTYLVETGGFDGHLDALRAEHRRRRDAFAAACARHFPAGAVRLSSPRGGLYFWTRLRSARAHDVQERALAAGVAVVAGDAFYADGGGTTEMRLCFSSVTPALADEGLRRLASVLGDAEPSVRERVRLV